MSIGTSARSSARNPNVNVGRRVRREGTVMSILEMLMWVGLELRRGTGRESFGFHQEGGQNR